MRGCTVYRFGDRMAIGGGIVTIVSKRSGRGEEHA